MSLLRSTGLMDEVGISNLGGDCADNHRHCPSSAIVISDDSDLFGGVAGIPLYGNLSRSSV
jgi:hypothetical protein